jgi:cytochrome c-type biogenesis protein CcmH
MTYFIILVAFGILVTLSLLIQRLLRRTPGNLDTEIQQALPPPPKTNIIDKDQITPLESKEPTKAMPPTSDLANKPRHKKTTLIGLITLLPVSVVGVYLLIGSPQHIEPIKPTTPIAMSSAAQQPDVDALIAQLVDHLAEQPNNTRGWFLLGRTYLKLGRYNEAVQALTTLHELTPEANAKVALADALTLQQQGQITPQAITLLQEALQMQPDSVTTLWLLGQAAKQQNQTTQALAYWQKALPLLNNQPEAQQTLREQIANLQPDTEATETAALSVLEVNVTLDDAWQDKVSPEDTLFIYAKAEQGSPMPLAVSRHKVAELPLTIQLNDSFAMMPQHKLSQFSKIRVGARISKTGQAIAQVGDIQSKEIQVDQDKTRIVNLIIDRKKP